tara:strand:- start:182 stop:535 length:354 start_codon:yes stop_codon:yes gene_type:complete
MNKAIFISLFLIVFSCKEKSDSEVNIRGTFIYFEDAAVLQSNNEIYGVYLDNKANELIEKAKNLKASESDEIKVELLGRVSTKNDDKIFWNKKFKITRIINISLRKEKQKTIILGEN